MSSRKAHTFILSNFFLTGLQGGICQPDEKNKSITGSPCSSPCGDQMLAHLPTCRRMVIRRTTRMGRHPLHRNCTIDPSFLRGKFGRTESMMESAMAASALGPNCKACNQSPHLAHHPTNPGPNVLAFGATSDRTACGSQGRRLRTEFRLLYHEIRFC